MLEVIRPDWAAPAGVQALVTTRQGGVSTAPWDSLNLGDHVGDSAAAVSENRRRLATLLPAEPLWLQQVHGVQVVDAAIATSGTQADASWARQRGVVCAVLTADCLPILLCDASATVVSAVHAGWRGLAGGVIESAVHAMAVAPESLFAWIGPGIGPSAFEVGGEVRDIFCRYDEAAEAAFHACSGSNKYLADLPALAAQRLARCGVRRVTTTEFCTYRDADRFFSYRRDGVTGRMASCIWLA